MKIRETFTDDALSAPIGRRPRRRWARCCLRPVRPDEIRESSTRLKAFIPENVSGGCGVTTSKTDSVGGSCSTEGVVARRGCTWCSVHKDKVGLKTHQTN